MAYRKSLACMIALSAIAAASPPALASPAIQASEDGAIQAVVRAYEAAWNRNDVPALRAMWTDDMDWINIVGMWWQGAEENAGAQGAMHATMFKGVKIRNEPASIRYLRPDLAIVVYREHVGDYRTPDGTMVRGMVGRISMVMVKTDVGWKIAHGQNTPIALGAQMPPKPPE